MNPSGYTSEIYNGKDVSLRNYLLRSARGMGFAIMQREEPLDKPIRHRIPDTSYYEKRLNEALEQLEDLHDLSLDDANKRAEAEYQEKKKAYEESHEKNLQLYDRYTKLIKQVEAWEPDPLLAPVKKHALEQLLESRRFDAGNSRNEVMKHYPYPKRLSGSDWLEQKRAKAEEDVEYYKEKIEEEYERVEEANKYIDALYDSLPEE